VYDTGCCVYFYFGFVWKGLTDPIKVFSEVEVRARAVSLSLSLSRLLALSFSLCLPLLSVPAGLSLCVCLRVRLRLSASSHHVSFPCTLAACTEALILCSAFLCAHSFSHCSVLIAVSIPPLSAVPAVTAPSLCCFNLSQ
jgi:hypothetical protein